MPVTVLAAGTLDIGTSFRRQRPGPESDLIQWFLDDPPIPIPSGSRMTIFQEPRLESGFPDLVIVLWREQRTFDWSPSRLKLTSEDIRLLHCLHHNGPAAPSSLEPFFGQNTISRLQRLRDADVAYFRSDMWRARPLKNIFAVKQIIAIEAKTDYRRGGLQQALLNTWFASISYLLTPHLPRGEDILERAAAFGIGLWSRKGGILHRPSTTAVPRSYASWLFNEWVWKAELFSRQKN